MINKQRLHVIMELALMPSGIKLYLLTLIVLWKHQNNCVDYNITIKSNLRIVSIHEKDSINLEETHGQHTLK